MRRLAGSPRVGCRSCEAPQELDQRAVDLVGAFLLGPVAAARQHQRAPQLRHRVRQVRDHPVHVRKRHDEITLARKIQRIFTGWMFAASPGLHAVDNAVYDVWLTDCKTKSDVPAPSASKK